MIKISKPKIVVLGGAKEKFRFPKQEINVGILRGIKSVEKPIVNYIVKKMYAQNTGEAYYVPSGERKGDFVRASRPFSGEYPSVRSGALKNTIQTQHSGQKSFNLNAGSPEVDYADELEETRNYLKDTVKHFEDDVKIDVARHINKALEKKGFKIT